MNRHPALAVAWTAAFVLAVLVAPLHAQGLPRELHPLRGQTSDEVIAADFAAIDGWQEKLETLPGADKDPWRRVAARAWLDAARVEYADNDRTGFTQGAFGRAVLLIGEIEARLAPVTHLTVPSAVPPHGSARIGDSLYVELEHMKRDSAFVCATEELARLEVELAWAGNEQVDLGNCWSSPHLAAARLLANVAKQRIEACRPAPVVLLPPQPPVIAKVEKVLVPKIEIPTVEELRIPRSVHFALAKWDITPSSLEVIAGIAALLDKYPTITVRLEGHTDSRGNAVYNLALSERRVMAARDVFRALGIDSSRISTAYEGKARLVAAEDSKRGFALNRRVEMVFVDSEGRDIKATHQERDLQLEADRPVAPVRRKAAVTPPGGARRTAGAPSAKKAMPTGPAVGEPGAAPASASPRNASTTVPRRSRPVPPAAPPATKPAPTGKP